MTQNSSSFFSVCVAHDVVLKIKNSNAGAVYNNSINEVSKALEELENCNGKKIIKECTQRIFLNSKDCI